MKQHSLSLVFSLFFSITALMAQPAMASLPHVVIAGNQGGLLDKSPFDTDSIKGKVYALFHVDPDEKDLNNDASEALKTENFSKDKFGSIAIINMGATHMPNFLIEVSLKLKQKRYPDTIYVKDFNKTFVKEWKLQDDSSSIIIFDKNGNPVYRFEGKLPADEIAKMIKAVRDNL